jgi:hypothetical protein
VQDAATAAFGVGYGKVKVKVNFTAEKATKARRGIRSIDLLFL